MQGLNVFSLLLITAGSSIPNPGCGQVGQESKPNILFCIADDATWMHMGDYGCRWVKTPFSDGRIDESDFGKRGPAYRFVLIAERII